MNPVDFLFSQKENTLRCTFQGKMDTEVSSMLYGVVEKEIEKYKRSCGDEKEFLVIFDLGKVSYVSSFFLRICFVAIKNVNKNNFSIQNATQHVNNILKLSGLDQMTKVLNVTEEGRLYPPSAEFSEKAHIKSLDQYKELYNASIDDPETFWRRMALENLTWSQTFDKVLSWKLPDAQWFNGGKLNASVNCLDKYLESSVADKTAIIWNGEPFEHGDAVEKRTLTYKELHHEVCRFSSVLKHLYIEKGDRVLIYLPMIPEAVVAMLACARIGAIHSVVFAGFSAQSIADRVQDCGAKLIITADGSYRRGKVLTLKNTVDEALTIRDQTNALLTDTIKNVLIVKHASIDIPMTPGRDVWLNDLMNRVGDDSTPEVMDSEDTLFILYTSGSTGKPKGIFHSTAGYLLGVNLTFRYCFDIKPEDIFWCSADIGWITGHSYVVYGALQNGATIFMYEGAPDYPEPDRCWQIIERNRISIFYTAPTAIRAFMKWGDQWAAKHDLSSVRLLGSVGEPINPESWLWYYEKIGSNRCPIVDTWWQTETGHIMISPMPGATPLKPGSGTLPFFGVLPDIVDDEGNTEPVDTIGKLIIRKPWPGIARGIWNDSQRFLETYWSEVPGNYFTGDSARKDRDGYYWIVGRVDDVIVVSGHNIGSAEVENAIIGHKSVAESAVVARPDDVKNTVIIAFVSLKTGVIPSDELKEEIRKHVSIEMGNMAKPEEIRFVESLPKTRSGKIMRRLLKQIAAGTDITGDITTLDDFNVIVNLTEE